MGKCDCVKDVTVQTMCLSKDPDSSYVCSRPEGHEGKHRACAPKINYHNFKEWEQE
jgi:hypothetical protein